MFEDAYQIALIKGRVDTAGKKRFVSLDAGSIDPRNAAGNKNYAAEKSRDVRGFGREGQPFRSYESVERRSDSVTTSVIGSKGHGSKPSAK